MAAITGAAIAVGTAGYQIYNAEKQKKEAKKAIEDFDRQDLDNPYANIQISTIKAQQQTEANNINFATSIDALQRGGSRTLLGGIPKINQSNILLQNLISSDLERQDIERQKLIAQGEERIRAIREKREVNALQGLGQQLQTARQDEITGISNLVTGGLALGSAIKNATKKDTKDTDDIFDSSGIDFQSKPSDVLDVYGGYKGNNSGFY